MIKKSILLVDDDKRLKELLKDYLNETCKIRIDNGQNRSFSMVSPVDFLTFLGLRYLFWANLFYF